jgi:hypothetical protein
VIEGADAVEQARHGGIVADVDVRSGDRCREVGRRCAPSCCTDAGAGGCGQLCGGAPMPERPPMTTMVVSFMSFMILLLGRMG